MKHQPGSAQPSLFDFLMDDPFSESANRPKPKPEPEPVTAKSEDPPQPKPKPRAVPAPLPKPVPPPEPKVVQTKPAKTPTGPKKTPPAPVVPLPEPPSTPQKQNSKLMAVPEEPKPPTIEPPPQPPQPHQLSLTLPRKACPFCKREVLSLAKTTRPAQGMAVECLKCGFRGGVGVNEAEAVAKWDKDGLRNKGARLVQTLERSKKKSEGAK